MRKLTFVLEINVSDATTDEDIFDLQQNLDAAINTAWVDGNITDSMEQADRMRIASCPQFVRA